MKAEEDSLHHGGGDEAAVLDGGERRGQVGRVRGLHHLLVPVHHIQVTVELFPNFLGQLRKHKSRRESLSRGTTRKPSWDAALTPKEASRLI